MSTEQGNAMVRFNEPRRMELSRINVAAWQQRILGDAEEIWDEEIWGYFGLDTSELSESWAFYTFVWMNSVLQSPRAAPDPEQTYSRYLRKFKRARDVMEHKKRVKEYLDALKRYADLPRSVSEARWKVGISDMRVERDGESLIFHYLRERPDAVFYTIGNKKLITNATCSSQSSQTTSLTSRNNDLWHNATHSLVTWILAVFQHSKEGEERHSERHDFWFHPFEGLIFWKSKSKDNERTYIPVECAGPNIFHPAGYSKLVLTRSLSC
jgi:hypothetical protein